MSTHVNWFNCYCDKCHQRQKEAAFFGLMLQRVSVELPDSPLAERVARADSLTDRCILQFEAEGKAK